MPRTSKRSSQGHHKFGGGHTEVKQSIVAYYSDFFCKVLNGKFSTWYVDAFAGSGERVVAMRDQNIFEPEPEHAQEAVVDGSARQALGLQPGFDHHVFIEQRKDWVHKLEQLRLDFPTKSIEIFKQDANVALSALIEKDMRAGLWRSGRTRGLVFLDQYATQVSWSLLEKLAATKSIDVWYFFNVSAIERLSPIDISAMTREMKNALDRVYGVDAWEELYSLPVESDLFGNLIPKGRHVGRSEIFRFTKSRMEMLFSGFVSDPILLETPKLGDAYCLFCMSNNTDSRAVSLIRKGVQAAIRRHG